MGTNEHMHFFAAGESEKKEQTEREVWEQKVKKDAQADASKGKGSVTLGGVEAQLKRLSEQVTRDAQEKQKRSLE
jgi:hypothetical protein